MRTHIIRRSASATATFIDRATKYGRTVVFRWHKKGINYIYSSDAGRMRTSKRQSHALQADRRSTSAIGADEHGELLAAMRRGKRERCRQRTAAMLRAEYTSTEVRETGSIRCADIANRIRVLSRNSACRGLSKQVIVIRDRDSSFTAPRRDHSARFSTCVH